MNAESPIQPAAGHDGHQPDAAESVAVATDSLFPSDLPEPREEQFRMRRLQTHNWGTFSGLVEVPIAERGFLFVGRSGSGKSTLLDAMSALLTPPAIVDFNAAAREAERSGRDRNLVSYVRGAWADQHDAGSGEIATQYLRRGATWSALVLEYRNALGATVSLVRLFWIAGAGSAAADVRQRFMVTQRAFDIVTELEGFDLDLRKLKRRLGDDVHHFETFASYAERFRRQLGIDSEMALRLLHKTQSAKNLGDLNQFLRGFMLDEPKTFAAADHLIDGFAELDAAHKAVVTAREQVETLLPARDDHQQLLALHKIDGELREIQTGIDPGREQRRLGLIEARIAELDTRALGLQGEQRQREQALDNLEQQSSDLQRQRREQGGDRIDGLEREHARVEGERDDRLRSRSRAEDACRALGQALAGGAQGFAEQRGQARQYLEDGRDRATAFDEAMAAQQAAKRDHARRFAEVRAEIEVLERHGSSVPAHVQQLRRRLCEATGLAENVLPFAAELLQVRVDEAPWRGAIERVLHGFAQSLLVDDGHHAAVSAWVERTHLAGKLVYYRVQRRDLAGGRQADSRSLLHKLEIRDHVHRDWLRNELLKRFDYACVDSLSALRQADKAITRQGQLKHSGERYEKDDRRRIDDRKHWMLAFDNRDKLALFKDEARELAQAIADCEREIDTLRQQRSQGEQRQLACDRLANLAWDEIDVAPKLQRLRDIDEQLQQLKHGDANLRALGERLDQLRGRCTDARNALDEARIERSGIERQLGELRDKRDACQARAGEVTLTPLQARGLSDRLTDPAMLTLDNLDARFRALERGLIEQLEQCATNQNRLLQDIVECLRTFCRRWPQDSADFTATIDSIDDFLARLRRLESDGLPQHEARFFDLLQTQSKQNLLVLQKHMTEARKSIAQRLEEVNDSLEQVSFNHGTILTIEVSDRRLPEVVEFQHQLRDVLGHHQTGDRELAEAQFATLRGLVARLGATEPDARRWRQQVLDVRLHVEFVGIELEAGSRVQVEIYRSGAGKSGGQRQKLATTCLAAALRYQLGGDDGHLPRYAAVVLDEAFDKADNEFTALAMNIFENFGFQMIVATPLKSVMTLEPYIGGACFVEINGRHDSSVLMIEYDSEARRLALPERVRQRDAVA